MRNTLKLALTLPLIFALTACASKPDISGFWVDPKPISADETEYFYYEIIPLESKDRYKVYRYFYTIKAGVLRKNAKMPFLEEKGELTLSFAKDNTYCVDGSGDTQCFYSVDDKTLDISFIENGRWVKSETRPNIPVNR